MDLMDLLVSLDNHIIVVSQGLQIMDVGQGLPFRPLL